MNGSIRVIDSLFTFLNILMVNIIHLMKHNLSCLKTVVLPPKIHHFTSLMNKFQLFLYESRQDMSKVNRSKKYYYLYN